MYDNSSANLSDSADANDLSNSSDSIRSHKPRESYSREELINNIEGGLDDKNSAIMILSRAIENCDAPTGFFDNKKPTQIVKADLNKVVPFINKMGQKFNYINRYMGSMSTNIENLKRQNDEIIQQNSEIKQQNNELMNKIQLYERAIAQTSSQLMNTIQLYERAVTQSSSQLMTKINECCNMNKNIDKTISNIQQQQKEMQKVTIDAFNASKEASDYASINMDKLEASIDDKLLKEIELTQKIANATVPQDISNTEDIVIKTCRCIAHDPESQNKKITKKFLKEYTNTLLSLIRSDVEKQVIEKITKQYNIKMEKTVRIKVKQAEERLKEQYNQRLKEYGCNLIN